MRGEWFVARDGEVVSHTLGLRWGDIRGPIEGGTGSGRRATMRCGCSLGIVKETGNFARISQPNRGTGQVRMIRKKCGKECWPN